MNKYDEEFLNYIKDIINSDEFIKRKEYEHHENESVYDHSLKVAYSSYLFAKKHNLNVRDISIGALLHDFYKEPWKNNTKHKPLLKKHGFVHAKEARDNAYLYFPQLMNERVENIILRHMFPLNIHPPKYREAWIVTLMDKKCSLSILSTPKVWFQYLGLKRKKG